MFAIYTDSLTSRFDNVCVLKYADDTAIVGLCKDKYLNCLANYHCTIEEVIDWCKRHSLLINGSKTKEVIVDFRTAQYHDPITVDNCAIDVVSDFKYLGLTFSRGLTWDTHIDNMLVKVRQRLFCVRKLAGFGLKFEKQLWLFQVMVFSVIIYCAPVWLSS